MAQITYRGNLTVGYNPFLVSLQGQTVIIPKIDQNVTTADTVLTGEGNSDRDRGFPQVAYMHNVLPTKQGFKSVGYNNKIAGLPSVNSFQDIFTLRDINENKFFYSPVSGKHYVFDGTVGVWSPASSTIISSSGLITVAYLNGNTYIFFQGIGCYQYDTVSKTLLPVVFIGINAPALNGICASNGYLIVWDNFNVYRSQPLAVLNFTPDPTQGSGGSIPNDINGQIICCLPIADGFIVYCAKNAVAASFQNNIQYPFIYKEVKGSGGISTPTQVTWTANLGLHYVWSTNGLQTVNKLQATQVFPEVTDFLTSKIYETFDTTLIQLIVTKLASNLAVKLSLISDRYFVISYGVQQGLYTDALIYDMGYKRWGKVKITHVTAFQYYTPNTYGEITWNLLSSLAWQDLGNASWQDLFTGIKTTEQPNDVIAFLQVDGTIQTLALDMVTQNELGVILLGKYQYIRSNWLILDEVTIQNVTVAQFALYDLPTYNGITFQAAQPLFLDPDNNGDLGHYYSAIEASNHTLAGIGTFDWCDFELTFHLGGHA